MAALEEFESMLKDVVYSKRLSQSKMTKLTDIALKNMQHDTQLVSILYRAHKALSPKSKVSSLYVFDALCRAARHQVTKQGLTANINAETGNPATFLLKVEGVLDGLITDMASVGTAEAKEKTKKILDIWTKSNTFSSAVIARLSGIAARIEKETIKPSTSTLDPRVPHQVTPPIPAPPAAPTTTTTTTPPGNPPNVNTDQAQAALLALLTSAAAAATSNGSQGQTSVNKASSSTTGLQPQLDPLQLALLQQLAGNANIGTVAPGQPVSLPTQLVSQQHSPPAPVGPVPGILPPGRRISSPPSYRDHHTESDRRDLRYNKYDEPFHGRGGRDYYDDRREYRGRGAYRGRVREDYRSRYGDRDRFDRDRDEDWGPPRRKRSRSRSPPARSRIVGRRDVKPYSPPHRPSIAAVRDQEHIQRNTATDTVVPPTTGKDEFGRDIRAGSPDTPEPALTPNHTQVGTGSTSIAADQAPSIPAVNHEVKSPGWECEKPAPTTGNTKIGLDRFEFSNFNFTDPQSWKALGDAFEVTNKYTPSQEELLSIVSAGMMMANQWGNQGWSSSSQTDYNNGSAGAYSGAYAGMWNAPAEYSAVNSIPANAWPTASTEGLNPNATGALNTAANEETTDFANQTSQENAQPNAGSMGGHMQKVGDKWVFVRDGEAV